MTPAVSAPDAPGGVAADTAADVAARVHALVAVPGRLLVIADFDGTLADYHPDPMGAFLAPGVRPILRRLARRAAADPERLAVVVLSGRAAPDLVARVRVGGIRYLGNHGNEGGDLARGQPAEGLRVEFIDGLEAFVEPSTGLGDAVAEAVAEIADGRPEWLFVERKGPSVGFHYRAAADHDLARHQLDEAIVRVEAAGLTKGFRRIDQRLIIEFQPHLAGAKGAAVGRLLTELLPTAALVLGDDVPDAEAFEAVHAAAAAGRLHTATTVAVSHGRPLHPDLAASADLVVGGTRGAASVLRALAVSLDSLLEDSQSLDIAARQHDARAVKTYSALEVRRRFGEIVDEAAGGERIVIERGGVPVAGLVPLADLDAHDPERIRTRQLEALREAASLGRAARQRHGSFDAAAAVRADRGRDDPKRRADR